MIRLLAFMYLMFCIAVYMTCPVKTVPELIITGIGVVVGIYYAFFRNLDDVMP